MVAYAASSGTLTILSTMGRTFRYRSAADPVEKQRPGQPVLQTSGRMGRFVFQIEIYAFDGGKFALDQMGIGGTLEIGFDRRDRPIAPVSHKPTRHPVRVVNHGAAHDSFGALRATNPVSAPLVHPCILHLVRQSLRVTGLDL